MSRVACDETDSFGDFFVRGVSAALNQNHTKDSILELHRQGKLWTRNKIDKGGKGFSQIIFYNGMPLIGLRSWTEFETSHQEHTATLKAVHRFEFFPV